MNPIPLFTYGTLMSSQPEHAIHCERPLSTQPAQARGSLWKLREGYPILQIDPNTAILDASADLLADTARAAQIAQTSAPQPAEGKWIQGELMEISPAPDALRKMDEWENFAPGVKSAYQRRMIWIKDQAGLDRAAWAYVCYSPPNWASLLQSDRWSADAR
ncbi:gamma-glutamylcyclotransferase family protein [Pelagicoccus sp. SDUM812003]|uniref:gamma-glutamylcyclotransferase family protein n=1 Tax=Pelagicoccus sp. SDUM812003 TaxID=3041267 RepID=UPI00281040C7|nr:gamma-glutamylcyclotransferase family protein [Pelagicoccus sp. SDUM812003]MDQ8202265.1 gamma-glutamylcyclotransferase [Pelagicoccus sp. SDUM812003]